MTDDARQRRVSKAEIARALAACHEAGLTVFRVVVRDDGVAIETEAAKGAAAAATGQIIAV
jgi:hypothetical protein